MDFHKFGLALYSDTGVSHFVTKQFHIGAVGYFFQQISNDSGSGATPGGFRSRVAGIGPQVGYIFPLATCRAIST